MDACEIVLAAILLTTPGEVLPPSTTEPIESTGHLTRAVAAAHQQAAAWAEALRPDLLTLAVDAEAIDPRECTAYLSDPALLLYSLTGLRKQCQSTQGLPLVCESERFPDREAINKWLALNRNVRNYLTERLQFDLVHADELRAAIVETDQLYQIWDMVRDSRCEFYYVGTRRASLKALRDLIGVEAYYSGQLPAPIPLGAMPVR